MNFVKINLVTLLGIGFSNWTIFRQTGNDKHGLKRKQRLNSLFVYIN